MHVACIPFLSSTAYLKKVGAARRWVEALFENIDTENNKPHVEGKTDDRIVGENFFRIERDY